MEVPQDWKIRKSKKIPQMKEAHFSRKHHGTIYVYIKARYRKAIRNKEWTKKFTPKPIDSHFGLIIIRKKPIECAYVVC